MPSPGACCCPPDVTKAALGLPDVIDASVLVLTTLDTGMPPDTETGDLCPGCDPETEDSCGEIVRFTNAAGALDAFSGVAFDFVEATGHECSACCFRYNGRTNHTLACGDAPTFDPYDVIALSGNPFSPRACGGTVRLTTYVGGGGRSGTAIIDGTPCGHVDGGCTNTCCTSIDGPPGEDGRSPIHTFGDCRDKCGGSGDVTDSTLYTPESFFATAGLYICVDGNVATLQLSIDFGIECTQRTGSGSWTLSESGDCDHGACTDNGGTTACELADTYSDPCSCDPAGGGLSGPPGNACGCGGGHNDVTGSDTCADNRHALVLLSATADLTGVAGATLWDKIKAATWISDYEFSMCNCGGPCCGESVALSTFTCTIGFDCHCFPDTLDFWQRLGGPIPLDCQYAVGTAQIVVSDG